VALCLALLPLGCVTSSGSNASKCPSVPEARAATPSVGTPSPAEVAQGKALFQEHCADCHASDPGERIFIFRGVPSLECPTYAQAVSPSYLHQVIAGGGKAVGESRLMPAFADKLSQQQIQSLVAFLRAPGSPQAPAP